MEDSCQPPRSNPHRPGSHVEDKWLAHVEKLVAERPDQPLHYGHFQLWQSLHLLEPSVAPFPPLTAAWKMKMDATKGCKAVIDLGLPAMP